MCDNASIPSARELFLANNLTANIVVLVVGFLLVAVTIALYLEMVVFIIKHFQQKERQVRTIWIMAIYPVFSFCSMIGVMVPRATTIVDLVMDVFLSSCLYQFLLLLEDYIGSTEVEKVHDRKVKINTPPLCCCCICLPTVTVSKAFVNAVRLMVLQVAVVRPILSFIAAVMWADGVYMPGHISSGQSYIYMIVLNLTSSNVAVWGLFLMRRAFDSPLEPYKPAGKFLAIQFVILLTVIPGLVINILVRTELIPCSETLPSSSRGDRVYHMLLVLLMLPLLVLARYFYRRQWEGAPDWGTSHHSGSKVSSHDLTPPHKAAGSQVSVHGSKASIQHTGGHIMA